MAFAKIVLALGFIAVALAAGVEKKQDMQTDSTYGLGYAYGAYPYHGLGYAKLAYPGYAYGYGYYPHAYSHAYAYPGVAYGKYPYAYGYYG
ncbi:lamprin 0.9-like [Cimex lectularius]|uniref:CPR type cuticle protein n=1 Tax=Cimex lectularius TaxID=79782 RepID=A0A8I6RWL3_CIMLE|nr:lamprin 0.9-like [Cimex lectularius]